MANKHTGEQVALLVHIFYTDLAVETAEYINRIPFECDIYFSASGPNVAKKFTKALILSHTIITIECPNEGMDIGPFFHQLKYIKDNKKAYAYYLKIHSKKEDTWRRSMFEACLPVQNYDEIFRMIDEFHMVGSESYLFRFCSCHQNKNIILKKIEQYHLPIQEADLYDQAVPFDPESQPLDSLFYGSYHQDLHLHTLPFKHHKTSFHNRMQKHWEQHGRTEAGRIPNPDLIKSLALKDFNFYAGTVFWFDQKYLDFLLENTDPFEEIFMHLSKEPGKLINHKSTYTHHLEYWFGLLASHLNGRPLKGIKTITILLPFIPSAPTSGGFRTILRFIDYLQKDHYLVNIQICWERISYRQRERSWIARRLPLRGKEKICFEESRDRIDQFNEVEHIEDLNIWHDDQAYTSDVYVATGWQTFFKALQLKQKGKVVNFFCQDLEYLFQKVQQQARVLETTKKFYAIKLPTFTMSTYLFNALDDGRIMGTTSFNVDRKVYGHQGLERNGICLLYDPAKRHRKPELVKEIALALGALYPEKTICLFGGKGIENQEFERPENIILMGMLPLDELAHLYNKSELGVCFSTTNPSRIPFEMAACGLPCIEADNEFTKYDLTSEAFIRMNLDLELIVQRIQVLLADRKVIEFHRKACLDFSAENFHPLKEEKEFTALISQSFGAKGT